MQELRMLPATPAPYGEGGPIVALTIAAAAVATVVFMVIIGQRWS